MGFLRVGGGPGGYLPNFTEARGQGQGQGAGGLAFTIGLIWCLVYAQGSRDEVPNFQLRIWILEPIPILQIQLTCGMSVMMVCFFSWISQQMHFLSILDTFRHFFTSN